MKKASITRRESSGKVIDTLPGWEAEIYGVTVVLCKNLEGSAAKKKEWLCCEPITGMTLGGKSFPTRDEALANSIQVTERLAGIQSKTPHDFLAELIAKFQAKHKSHLAEMAAGGSRG